MSVFHIFAVCARRVRGLELRRVIELHANRKHDVMVIQKA